MIAGDVEAFGDDVEGVLKSEKGEEKVAQARGKWLGFYQNVAEVVQGKTSAAVSVESVVRSLRVIETGIKSAETGQVIQTNI